MRMLVIVDKRLPSDHSFIQGVLAKSLPRLGVDVTFFGLSQHLKGHTQIEGVDYWLFKPWQGGLFIEALQMILMFPQFVWRVDRFDAVFTRNDPVALILGWLYKRLRNPNARHLHQISNLHAEAILQSQNASLWYKIAAVGDLAIRRLFLAKAARIFAVSERMKQDLIAKYPKATYCMDFLPLGILKEDFENPLEYESRPTDVVYIGTLAASRRLNIVIDAVEIYNRHYGHLMLKIWGASHNPEDDLKLKEYVRRKGLEDLVQFFGRVPREEMLRDLMAAKIGICTIPPEGFLQQSSPTKLMEYLAAGCCVIATRGIPDQDTIIEASGGGIFVNYQADTIAEGIHQLLSQPEEAACMSARGRTYIFSHRDYGAMARKVKSAAENALEQEGDC